MCERYGKPLSVISMDVDHFKQINDAHGHAAGDDVLRGVSETLRTCVRASDCVCRVGGEEFLIILPQQTLQEAEVCAERCRAAIAAREFASLGGALIHATISAGIAHRRPGHGGCHELLNEADEALYAAKRAGRNVVRSVRGQPPAHVAESRPSSAA